MNNERRNFFRYEGFLISLDGSFQTKRTGICLYKSATKEGIMDILNKDDGLQVDLVGNPVPDRKDLWAANFQYVIERYPGRKLVEIGYVLPSNSGGEWIRFRKAF